jgi:hypothetical protein
MRRTSIFLNPTHMKELAALGNSQGLRPSHLVRVAILQYIRREKRTQAAQIALPGRTRRQAALLGE